MVSLHGLGGIELQGKRGTESLKITLGGGWDMEAAEGEVILGPVSENAILVRAKELPESFSGNLPSEEGGLTFPLCSPR